jgi:uncharacterized membrane protein YbhN (UPF0104 family)
LTRRRILFAATLVAAIAILVVLATRIDLAATFAQIGRVGISGAELLLLAMALAMLGPLLAWHILMGSEGIRIGLRTTLTSGLMGRSVNLISPMMYFGGEGVRTFHIASVTGISRRRVLATIVAAEFQALTALSASIVAALMVVAGSVRSDAMPIAWMVTGSLSLAAIVGAIFCVLLLDLHLAARFIGFLIRCGIFPGRLRPLRQDAADVEDMVRSLLVRNKLRFLAAQLLVFLSPLAQFILPAIFFWLLRAAGQPAPQPTLSQLASFFVLVQLLFMIPTTPAGLGVYEGGIVGIFRLHGWNIPDGAAYAILVRMDDVLFSVSGAVLLAGLGLTSFLKGSSDV